MSRPGRALVFPIIIGRLVRLVTRLRGGGSAFPGWVVRKLRPRFISEVVAQLPHGIVVVLGSNGKSTTTNMVTGIMRAHGLRVFTNPSGANLPQGIASSLLAEASLTGRLAADVGVIEVDEAFGRVICDELHPHAGVILNLQIDQIYRFFEPERVAGMFRDIAATISTSMVLNRDDQFLRGLGRELEAEGRLDVSYFGVAADILAAAPHGLVTATDYGNETTDAAGVPPAHVVAEITALAGRDATIATHGAEHPLRMPTRGLHYAVDTAAALSLSEKTLGGDFRLDVALEALQSSKTVYGRGEILPRDDAPIEILLLKNLASLQMNLDYLEQTPDSVLFALDEGSKDPSWLYAADFSKLRHVDVISGPKASFIALRLAYAGVTFDVVEEDIEKAVKLMLDKPVPPSGQRTFILDYDQMILTRRMLGYRDLEAGAA
ncbi:MurT ligase domain-containing protein [Microbacterium sp. STN6]|uniref:MurT ligase domain-containing protein n=1 Tax=Microbacterium sp. STN6 TaxID=2995588 RepID=UPI002260949B|nr:MurT ligase domain-containing protein [Microbacterium sp. STN6]MCX7522431.1 MurT ligase domain-containing protein [Microbacterium sp. STN6]